MSTTFELAKIIGSPHNLMAKGVIPLVEKYRFKSFEDYAKWREKNNIKNFDMLHEEIMTALMES